MAESLLSKQYAKMDAIATAVGNSHVDIVNAIQNLNVNVQIPFLPASWVMLTPVNVALLSVVIAPTNLKRRGFFVWNNGANSAYLSFAATSSSSTPCKILATFTSWEFFGNVAYTGPISAIRNAGTGNCVVLEALSA